MRLIFWIAALMLACAAAPFSDLSAAEPKAKPVGGVLPIGADGERLNLDFETGMLED